MPKRVPNVIWLVACLVTALIATQSPAYANPFPDNYDATVADPTPHTSCYTTGFTTDTSVASYAMWVLGDTTDLDDLFPTSPQFCSFMETDVWWWESNQPGSIRGVRECWRESPNGICTSSDIALDFAQLDSGSEDNDWEDRRKTAVHEVGHSIGLGDGTLGAMATGEIPDTSLTWRRYSAHDLSHINGAY